jgi:hypothetical protein
MVDAFGSAPFSVGVGSGAVPSSGRAVCIGFYASAAYLSHAFKLWIPTRNSSSNIHVPNAGSKIAEVMLGFSGALLVNCSKGSGICGFT